MKLQRKLNIGRFHFSFTLKAYWKRGVITIGCYDLCPDSTHVIFLDYDKFRFEWILDELRYLQRKFKLSTFYIFESSRGSFHAVCFDKLRNYELHKLLQCTNIDESFYSASFWDYGSRVLRLFPKGEKPAPSLRLALRSKYHKRLKSLDHIELFEKNYGIKIDKRNAERLGKVWMIKYRTEHGI